MLTSMNKNILIGAIAIFIIVGGAFLLVGGNGAFDTGQFTKDEAELSGISSDIELFSQDSIIFNEIDQTFTDISDVVFGVSAGDALSEGSINQEAAEVDLSQMLNDFAQDDTTLSEVEQGLGEVLQ